MFEAVRILLADSRQPSEKSDGSSPIWKEQCDSRVKPISDEKCASQVQTILNKECACQGQPISNEKCAGKVQLRRMKNEEWMRTKGMAPLRVGRFTQLILKPLDSPKNRRGISNAGQGCTGQVGHIVLSSVWSCNILIDFLILGYFCRFLHASDIAICRIKWSRILVNTITSTTRMEL